MYSSQQEYKSCSTFTLHSKQPSVEYTYKSINSRKSRIIQMKYINIEIENSF